MDFLSLLAVRQAVWIAPAVTAAHFLEEAPRFAKWARRHISPRYTDEHWRKIHGAGILFAIGVTGLVSVWPRNGTVFLFICFYLAPMLCNTLFHVGTSILYRSYSPGVITASLLHSTLFFYLISVFSGAGLLRSKSAAAATIVGALVHGLDLASTTFFVDVGLRTSARALVLLSLLGLRARADAQQNSSQQTEPASPLPMMVIQMKPGDTHLTAMTPGEGNLTRWFDLDAASISLRYRHVENFLGATSASNLQHQVAVRGAFHLDPGRRFSIYAGLFTGSSFTGGWDNTGPGARAQSNLYLKRLYFVARPIKGIEAQYGGLDFARGESSEITSYDYDGYLVGERVSIKRPQDILFDEVAVTYGHVGDFSRPSVFGRLKGLSRSNYHQFLITRHAGTRVRISADYTSESGTDTLRQAVTFDAPELRAADLLHFEQYERATGRAGYGFAAYGEKKAGHRTSLGGGYAQLDQPALFSDRFGVGKRLFWNSHIALSTEWSLMALVTYALAGPAGTAPRIRFDLVVGYNVLQQLRAVGAF